MSLEGLEEDANLAALACHYNDRLGPVGDALSRDGAFGLVLVDAARLERIEGSYGVQAHRKALEAFRLLVREACRADLEKSDLIVCGSASPDELAILFFRPRSDDRFYCERLPDLARRLLERIATHGQTIVYPYDRDAPYFPVGYTTVFHNPGLGTDRQLLEGFERARQDAALNEAIVRREQHKTFQDLVLAEDVAILYEPIVNLTTREILGHEALVRGPWKSELHSPDRLFQLAEETGLVFELDCLCRRTALREDSKPAASSF